MLTYRTSARLLETKTANASLQYNPATGKKPTAANNPAVVLAFDRVNGDGASYSAGQVPSVANGSQHAKPSFYGSSQGWDTVRRIFNPHRSESKAAVYSDFHCVIDFTMFDVCIYFLPPFQAQTTPLSCPL